MLDVVDADLGEEVPIPGQQENVLLGKGWFSEVLEHDPVRLRGEVEALIESRPKFLEVGKHDRIPFDEVKRLRVERSLALVEPRRDRWVRTVSYSGNPQVRCQFELAGDEFNLVVTDTAVETVLKDQPPGTYDRSVLGIPAGQRLLLTVSLASPFYDECYKLVAAAIALGG